MQHSVTQVLGYEESSNFLPAAKLQVSPHSHVYRQANERCGMKGVYLLRDPQRHSDIPVVFFCEAESEEAAAAIHRRIWNQDIVPFILVETPKSLRLYSGFRCNPKAASDREQGILTAAVDFNEAANRLEAIRADAIDSGEIWDRLGEEIDPRSRVDWSLLDALQGLERKLRERGLSRQHAHALIGKFVYLRYLRDRQILSRRKLERWRLNPDDVFSHRAKLAAFRELNSRLDEWLNGSVFPLPEDAIRAEHLQLVAGVFAGGSPRRPISSGSADLRLLVHPH